MSNFAGRRRVRGWGYTVMPIIPGQYLQPVHTRLRSEKQEKIENQIINQRKSDTLVPVELVELV